MRRFVCGLAMSAIALSSFFSIPVAAQARQSPQDLTVNADPADHTPHVLDGEVLAIAVVGNTVVLGGTFTQARNAAEGSPVLARSNLLAFDRTTGAIRTEFNPAVDSEVRTLAPGPDGTSVYVGGKFNTIDGQSRSKLTRVDVMTGVPTPGFAPGLINAAVFDVELAGERLLVAGYFTTVNGTARGGIAELDPSTGAVRPGLALAAGGTAWGGVTGVTKVDTTPDGSRMVMTGNFRTVAGLDRVQIAMVDLTTSPASVTDWSTGAYDIECGRSTRVQYDLRDVDFSPDGSYFVTVATGALGPPGALCDTAARWETSRSGAGQQPTWIAATGNDSVYSVALTGSTVYVGGHFRWFNNPRGVDEAGPGAVSREGIAALDPTNGLPLTWNPGRTRGRAVWDMVATPDALYVGSDTDRIGAFEYHARNAMFPLAGGAPVPQPRPPDLPVDVLLVSPRTTPGDVIERPDFDGTTAGRPETLPGSLPADTGAATVAAGRLYSAHPDGTLVRRTISGDVFTDPVVVDLNGLTGFANELARMTSMFTADGRLYYTLTGEKALYVRSFSVQSDVIGATREKAPGGRLGLQKVRGGFLTSEGLYLSQESSGDLFHVDWAGGAPVPGSRSRVSGPSVDGIDWSASAVTARDSA